MCLRVPDSNKRASDDLHEPRLIVSARLGVYGAEDENWLVRGKGKLNQSLPVLSEARALANKVTQRHIGIQNSISQVSYSELGPRTLNNYRVEQSQEILYRLWLLFRWWFKVADKPVIDQRYELGRPIERLRTNSASVDQVAHEHPSCPPSWQADLLSEVLILLLKCLKSFDCGKIWERDACNALAMKMRLHNDIEVDRAMMLLIGSLQLCARCANEYLEFLGLHGREVIANLTPKLSRKQQPAGAIRFARLVS